MLPCGRLKANDKTSSSPQLQKLIKKLEFNENTNSVIVKYHSSYLLVSQVDLYLHFVTGINVWSSF